MKRIKICDCFKNEPFRTFFICFHSFHTILQNKTADSSRIRTQIVRAEGEHADHLTTTTVGDLQLLSCLAQLVKDEICEINLIHLKLPIFYPNKEQLQKLKVMQSSPNCK